MTSAKPKLTEKAFCFNNRSRNKTIYQYEIKKNLLVAVRHDDGAADVWIIPFVGI